MRLNDLVFAFPALLSAIMITAIFGPGAINAIIAIGIFNIPVFARVARAGALAIWPREFILAARAAGKGKTLITIEHILPNIASLLLVQGTIQFALGILAEAGLSYVGLGAQPPMPSWGRMLFDAQTRMIVAPYLALFPGFAIILTVLGLNLLGDGICRHARSETETRAMSLLEIENLSLAIGDTPILNGIDLADRARRGDGAGRRIRLRQVDDGADRHAAAARCARARRAASASTASTSWRRPKTRCARCAATTSAWCSRSR